MSPTAAVTLWIFRGYDSCDPGIVIFVIDEFTVYVFERSFWVETDVTLRSLEFGL